MFNYLFNTYESVKPPSKIEDNLLEDLTSEDTYIGDIPYNYTYSTEPHLSSLYPGVTDQLVPLLTDSPLETLTTHVLQPVLKEIKLKSSKEFEIAFQQACKINPEVVKYKTFLVKTAKRESGFNSHILNLSGAPYYGYFLMGEDVIKATTGLTVELFRNDPVQLILGAVKLYKRNLKDIKRLGVYLIGRQRGYSDDALVSGAWMGGPGGVKKYLLGLGDPSDSHWYRKAGMKSGGSSVGKIMNNWKQNEQSSRTI